MGICSFFSGASSSKSTDLSSSSEDETDSNQSDIECLEPSPAKKRLTVKEKCRITVSSSRKYIKKWEDSSNWLIFDENFQGAFCKICRKRGISLQGTGGIWISKPFKNWKKAIEKMQAHAKSSIHTQSCKAEMATARILQKGSIVQQLQ